VLHARFVLVCFQLLLLLCIMLALAVMVSGSVELKSSLNEDLKVIDFCRHTRSLHAHGYLLSCLDLQDLIVISTQPSNDASLDGKTS